MTKPISVYAEKGGRMQEITLNYHALEYVGESYQPYLTSMMVTLEGVEE